MEQIDSFGEWVRQRRGAVDLTRAELAQCAGCSVSALRKIEADERRPSRQLARLLSGCLGIPPDERPAFVKAARGELFVARLGPPSLALVQEHKPPAPLFNLPIPPTPLIGREPELAMLGRLLRDPQCRLLTLIGPGGIGKTRLAIEIASRHQDCFPDGVSFVSLAALNSSTFLVASIADAVGFAFHGHIEPRIQLFNYLDAKQMLLVLDNLEHLLEGAGLFAELLACASEVKLLITSRERLNLYGEWTFEVQGLSVPPNDRAGYTDEYDAVALFVESARRADAGFALSASDLPAVVRICQLVDGMPLGLELAAPWVRSMSCQEIAEEIARNLDFLTTTMRNVPERHRSLKAIFEQSWERLSGVERAVLSKLSVFRGGCSREAAEAVTGATLPLLASLVDKSLLRHTEKGHYELHELIRQFTAEQSRADTGDHKELLDRHCQYYASFLKERTPAIEGGRQCEALAEIATEIENVRAGWRHALAHLHLEALRAFHRGLGLFYWLRGWFVEARDTFQAAATVLEREAPDATECQEMLTQILVSYSTHCQFLGQTDPAEAALRRGLALAERLNRPSLAASVLDRQARLATEHGDYVRARSLSEKALSIYQASGDAAQVARTLGHQGSVSLHLQEYGTALRQLQDSLTRHRRLNNLPEMMLNLCHLARVLIRTGAYAGAQEYLDRVVAICKQMNTPIHTSVHNSLGQVAEARGDYELARQHYLASLAYCERLHNEPRSGTPLAYLGNLARIHGGYEEAARWLNKSLAINQKHVNVREIARDYYLLGLLAQEMGDDATAHERFDGSHTLYEADENRHGMALGLHGLGELAVRRGELERARECFERALGLAAQIGAHPVTVQALLGLARYRLTMDETAEGLYLTAFVAAQCTAHQETRDRARALWAEQSATLSPGDLVEIQERATNTTLADVVARYLGQKQSLLAAKTPSLS